MQFSWCPLILHPSHFPIVAPTVELLFGHFPGLPTDLLIKSQVPGLVFKVLYDLASSIVPDKAPMSFHSIGRSSQTQLFVLLSITSHFPSRPLSVPLPLAVWTCYLLFKLQLLCQLSHKGVLAHASTVVILYLVSSCPISCPVAFKFLAGITIGNIFCANKLCEYTYTRTRAHELHETIVILIICNVPLMFLFSFIWQKL